MIQLPTNKIKATKKNPRLLLIYGAPKVGKALAMDSQILTKSGFKLMQDLNLEDEVAGSDGEFHKILGIYPQGEKQLYYVTFKDGTAVECCEEHLWTVENERLSKNARRTIVQTIPTKEMLKDFNFRDRYIYRIQYPSPINFPTQTVEISPYVLGILISDGSLRTQKRICLSNDKEEIVNIINNLEGAELKPVGQAWDYTITSKDLVSRIEQAGIDKNAYDKEIPEEYLLNSIENRISLLQGLLDGDGYADQLKSFIEYSTTSEKLVKQVKWLVRSLGGKAVESQREGKYRDFKSNKIIECRTSYRLIITFYSDLEPFRLTYKLHWYKANRKTRFVHKAIVDIRKSSVRECQCIEVDTKDKLFVVDGFNLTHNTTLAASLENSLILDLENGSDFVDAVKIKVDTLSHLSEIRDEIVKQNRPYKYVFVDTASALEDWCMDWATFLYKQSSVGKNFTGDNVLLLPNGAGYLWLRIAYAKALDIAIDMAEHVILILHVKDRMLVDKKGFEIASSDIDLTGKLKAITCSKADCVGYIYRKLAGSEGGKPVSELRINFGTNLEVVAGSRCLHLINQDFIFDWDKIFIKENE